MGMEELQTRKDTIFCHGKSIFHSIRDWKGGLPPFISHRPPSNKRLLLGSPSHGFQENTDILLQLMKKIRRIQPFL